MTTPVIEETHKATRELGPGVVGGRLLWTSASGITRADPGSDGGCLRKWWYEQVDGRRQPSSAAQRKGTALHAEIEEYLVDGRPLRTALALAGRHNVPERGPDLMVEASLTVVRDGKLEGAWLTVGSVVIAGHVDLWNHRGTYVDEDGDLGIDPPGTFETKDYKTTSDFCWAKTPADLARNVQMCTYAEAGFRMWPAYEHARLTHAYFLTRGRPDARLSTVLVDRAHVARQWERSSGIVREMAGAARETVAEKIPGNKAACGAFGGCPHRAYCRVGSHDALAELFGDAGAADVLARLKNKNKEDPMSLKDKLLNVTPLSTPAATAVSLAPIPSAVDAEVARLQAEESARAAARLAASAVPDGFREAADLLGASGRGMPMLTGRAAAAMSAVRGLGLSAGSSLAGSGWLGAHPNLARGVEDPSVLVGLAAEVAKLGPLAPPPQATPILVAPPAVAHTVHVAPPIALLPPDAPASSPALAALPVEGLDNAKTRELAAATATSIPGLAESVGIGAASLLAQGPAPSLGAALAQGPAPSLGAALAQVVDAVMTPPPPDAATAKKRGPGRPPGAKKTETTASTEGAATAPSSRTISVYVDVVAQGIVLESLTAYVDHIASMVLSGPIDRPALIEIVRQIPPPPGAYSVDTRGNALGEAVAIALETIAVESGGAYVRSRA